MVPAIFVFVRSFVCSSGMCVLLRRLRGDDTVDGVDVLGKRQHIGCED